MNNDLIRELRDIANDLDEVGRPRFAEIVDDIGLTVLAQVGVGTEQQMATDEENGQETVQDTTLPTMPGDISDLPEKWQPILQTLLEMVQGGKGGNTNRAVNYSRPNLTNLT